MNRKIFINNKKAYTYKIIYEKNNKNLNFILDVDGVLTDGNLFTQKMARLEKSLVFHDADGLNILKKNS